jgi:hypothetical protein
MVVSSSSCSTHLLLDRRLQNLTVAAKLSPLFRGVSWPPRGPSGRLAGQCCLVPRAMCRGMRRNRLDCPSLGVVREEEDLREYYGTGDILKLE